MSTARDSEYVTRPRMIAPAEHYIGRTRTGRARHLVDRTHDQHNPRGRENTVAECGREITVTDERWSGAGHWYGCETCDLRAGAKNRLRWRSVQRMAAED